MVEPSALHRRRRLQDGLLAALCVAGVALGSIPLLRAPVGRGESTSPGRALATVTAVASAVRIRPATTLIWNRVAPQDSTFASDALFVPADGAASLRFVDGTEIQLDPNTLIILDPPAGQNARPVLALREGSIVIDGGDAGLEIRFRRGDVDIARDSRVQVVESAVGTRVEVLEGHAQLAGADGKRDLGAHELGGFDEAGALRATERPPISLLAPGAQALVDLSDAPTALRWKPASEVGDVLQVSRDAAFAAPVLELRLPPGSNVHRLEIENPGTRWWRIVDGAGAARSNTASFRARVATSPVLIFPQMNQLVLAPPERGMVFTWSYVEGCSSYQIEIARDRHFATVVLAEKVEGPQLWVGHGLDEGNYFWRARGDGCGTAPFSSPGRFRLIAKPLLDAPTAMDAEIVEN